MYYQADPQTEFYRNHEFEMEAAGYEMRLLSCMPGEELAWYCELLVSMGDLLISSGKKLKDSARPSAALSQEPV
jgi:hypothetical protein